MNFDRAFEILVSPSHEGGYVNNPNDPGGETKYGISKRSYPEEDIPALTLERAKELYRRDFWAPSGGEILPPELRFDMFDLAVNTSARLRPTVAIKLLQRAVGAVPDGIYGPETLSKVAAQPIEKTLRRLNAARIKYYTALPSNWWHNFGKGVMNRVADNLWNA